MGLSFPNPIDAVRTVVETALSAIRSGKTTAVSGWLNYFVSVVGNAAPDWLVTRAMASQLRAKFDKE